MLPQTLARDAIWTNWVPTEISGRSRCSHPDFDEVFNKFCFYRFHNVRSCQHVVNLGDILSKIRWPTIPRRLMSHGHRFDQRGKFHCLLRIFSQPLSCLLYFHSKGLIYKTCKILWAGRLYDLHTIVSMQAFLADYLGRLSWQLDEDLLIELYECWHQITHRRRLGNTRSSWPLRRYSVAAEWAYLTGAFKRHHIIALNNQLLKQR